MSARCTPASFHRSLTMQGLDDKLLFERLAGVHQLVEPFPVQGFASKLVCHALEMTLDTGLRVREFCSLRPEQVEWQWDRVVVYGKGGPYGHRSKRGHGSSSEWRLAQGFGVW
ncbi:MAG: hypothetical protein IH988_04235 [Planctomycetes bacterium]|nr:hypothetical protein [Planctomycetota bacterium]